MVPPKDDGDGEFRVPGRMLIALNWNAQEDDVYGDDPEAFREMVD